MITVWYNKKSPQHNPHTTRSFHVGSCPIELDYVGNVTMVQADGHELDHILRTYPFLKTKLKLIHDTMMGMMVAAPVAQFYGSDAQYAAGSFLCYRSAIKPDARV